MSIRNQKLGRLFAALALTTMAAGLFSGSARADDYDRGRYGREHYDRGEEWRREQWRRDHRQYYGNRVYVAPPPVYYAPPPPPSGLNLFFHVR